MLTNAFCALEKWCLNTRFNLHVVLLVSFAFLAGLFTFLVPPFQAPDEFDHWTTANSRADALLGVEQSCHAAADLASRLGVLHLPFRTENKVVTGKFGQLPEEVSPCSRDLRVVNYGTILTYFQVFAARIFVSGEEGSPKKAALVYFLSRIISAVAIGLSLLRLFQLQTHSQRANSTSALGALILTAAFISPLALQQSVSVSADVPILIATILTYTTCFYAERMSKFDFGVFTVFGGIAAMTKPTIVPLLALPAVIQIIRQFLPDVQPVETRLERDSSVAAKVHRLLRGRGMLIWIVTTTLFFSAAGLYSTVQTLSLNQQETRVTDIDPAAQKEFVIGNPIKAVEIFRQSVSFYLEKELYFYQHLGWLDTPINGATSRLHKKVVDTTQVIEVLLLLLAAAAPLRFFMRWQNFKKMIRWPTLLATGLLTLWLFNEISEWGNALALYIGWTPPAADMVRGLQGRYFFPNAMMLQCVALGLCQMLSCRFKELTTQATVLPHRQEAKTSRWQTLPPLIKGSILLLIAYWLILYTGNLALDLAARYW